MPRLGLVLLMTMAMPATVLGQVPAYRDVSLPFERRAADLVKRMTLEEKIAQIHVRVPANKRLGIPAAHYWTEATHGLSNRGPAGGVTVFPQAIAMAASFNPSAVRRIGDATSTEARARYQEGVHYRGLSIWAPMIDMARDPRWGRVEETYGEDPFLTGRIAVAMIQGLQGDHSRYLKTLAVPKHFAVHGHETNRFSTCVDVPEPVIRDYYFPAFFEAFTEGGALGTMAAFTGINKVPNTANPWLLTEVLREEWGFQGLVTSDNGGVNMLVDGHKRFPSNEEAIVAALKAGLDNAANWDNQDFTPVIVKAIREGRLAEEVVDRAATRCLLVRMRLGELDPPEMVPYTSIPASAIGTREHVALALKMAQESMVLLQNRPAPRGYGIEMLLPLDLRRVTSVAVLGPFVNIPPHFGSYSGTPANPAPTILAGLTSVLGDRVAVRTAPWTNLEVSVRAARDSDVVVFVGGLNGNYEREGMDRSSLALPADQQRFLEQIVKANPLTVAVFQGGSVIGMEWVRENVPAAIMMWYAGEQGATALAQILTGRVNPSGRLPLTFHRDVEDLPPLLDYDITRGRTYWYNAKPVSFPFGHGLSYTTFEYRNLRVPASPDSDGNLVVTLDVANIGKYDGDEVVQLYVRIKDSPNQRPLRQLKAFERVSIPAGQVRSVTLSLPVARLGFWSTEHKRYAVEAGSYDIMIGASSEDIRAQAVVSLR